MGGFFCLYGLGSCFLSSSFSPGRKKQTGLFSPFHFLNFLQYHSDVVLGFLVNFLLAFWKVPEIGISSIACVGCIYKLCYLYAFFCKAWFFRTKLCNRFLQELIIEMERNLLSALTLFKIHQILFFFSNHAVKKVVDSHFPLGLQRVKSSSGINWRSSIQIRVTTLIHSSWGSSP